MIADAVCLSVQVKRILLRDICEYYFAVIVMCLICLESVISQDYNDMEILVIDDCSTDHSVGVINTMIAKHPERDFHFIVNETNLGLCQVRNISIEEAQGEAIYFIDGDDTIEMGTISLFHRRMVETGVEVVCGSFRKIDTKGNPYIIKQFPDDTIKGVFAYSSYIEKNIKDFFWLPIWNNLYRLEFLKTHNIRCATHYRKHEGSLFTFKVVLNAQSVSYIHDITYNWNDVPTSITNGIKRNSNYLEDFRAVIESVVEQAVDALKVQIVMISYLLGMIIRPLILQYHRIVVFAINFIVQIEINSLLTVGVLHKVVPVEHCSQHADQYQYY